MFFRKKKYNAHLQFLQELQNEKGLPKFGEMVVCIHTVNYPDRPDKPHEKYFTLTMRADDESVAKMKELFKREGYVDQP